VTQIGTHQLGGKINIALALVIVEINPLGILDE
jgi:hypothetical protein